jgi:hypothetical protein
MRTIASQNILKELFHTEVVHFERKQWPSLSAGQTAGADALVKREYERARAVTADVSKVEEAWQAYRDAWASFARLRYPASAEVIRAEITLDRYRLLKTIQ